MENRKAKFYNADQSMSLTITATEGKSGQNVKATMKGVGKGADRALTGARGKYDSEKDAQKAFDKLVSEAEKNGWVRTTTRVKNAFTEIPAAPKPVAKPATAKK